MNAKDLEAQQRPGLPGQEAFASCTLYGQVDGTVEVTDGDPDVVICVDESGPLNLQIPRPPADAGGGGPQTMASAPGHLTRPHGVRHLLAAYELSCARLYVHLKPRKRRPRPSTDRPVGGGQQRRVRHLRFMKSHGRMFGLLVMTSGEEEHHVGPYTNDRRDAGFVSMSSSPFNAYQSLIWVAGINDRATQAAALLLKDLALDGDGCLASIGLGGANPVGCVVEPSIKPMSGDRAPGEPPYTKWWIKRYRPIWAVDDLGRSLRITPR